MNKKIYFLYTSLKNKRVYSHSKEMAEKITVVSIDIGLRNLGLCKESFSISTLLSYSPPTEFYDKYGESLPDMKRYISEIGTCGSLTYWERKDLGDKKTFHAGHSYFNLIEWLDTLRLTGIFDDVHVILIEQQMKTNHIAVSLMHHIHSYLLIYFGRFKEIILYQSKHKTRVLGAALTTEVEGKVKAVTKYNRKKWSVTTITQLLTSRKDKCSLDILKKEKKKDDLCDTVAQCLSYIVTETLRKKSIKVVHQTLKKVKKENKKERLLQFASETKEKQVKPKTSKRKAG